MYAQIYCSNLSIQHSPSTFQKCANTTHEGFCKQKCWQQEWRMYSHAPKTLANLTQMLIYVCKMGGWPRKSWQRGELKIFATSAIFSKLFTSLASRHLPQYLLCFVAKLTISSSDFAPVALLWLLKPWLKILFFWGIKSCTWHSPPPWSVSLGFLTSLGGRCSRPDHLTRCWSVEQS